MTTRVNVDEKRLYARLLGATAVSNVGSVEL